MCAEFPWPEGFFFNMLATLQPDSSTPQWDRFEGSMLRAVVVTIGFTLKMSIESPAKCKIRGIIHYLIWKGNTMVGVYIEVKTAYGDIAMNHTRVFKWCCKFKNGHMSVHDQRSGWPSIDWQNCGKKIENALYDDCRLTEDELSAMFL